MVIVVTLVILVFVVFVVIVVILVIVVVVVIVVIIVIIVIVVPERTNRGFLCTLRSLQCTVRVSFALRSLHCNECRVHRKP